MTEVFFVTVVLKKYVHWVHCNNWSLLLFI